MRDFNSSVEGVLDHNISPAMAANAPPELASVNTCCLAWQGKYINMKKRRDTFKEAVSHLQKAIGYANAEKSNLEKKLEEMAADRATKEHDSGVTSLDKEIPDLKSEIVKDEEIKPHIPEDTKEISLVKNLLASERQKTESARKKADQYLSELEVLRATAHKTSSDLLTLTSNLETVKKQLEFEKQNTLKERKCADMESAKAREQMKLAESLSKKFETVRARNEELKKEMELLKASSKVKFLENSEKLEEKIRLLEMNKKTDIEWKSRADDLTKQLHEAQLVTDGLKKQIYELTLSQKSIKAQPISPHKVRDLEKAEVRLLKKELKFERACAKHSKKVAKFEKLRKEFQAEELGRLKLEFGSLTNRMNLLDEYFSRDIEGTTVFGKAEGINKLQILQSHKNGKSEKHSDVRCHLVVKSGSQEKAGKFSAQLIPKSGWGVSESVSGTISQLESPTGGSRQLKSSGVISCATYFSDGKLLASQGREQGSVATSAEIAKDKPIIHTTKSSMFKKISDTRKNVNLQSRQRESHEVVNEHSRKRKSVLEAVEPRKHLSSDNNKKNIQFGEKMGTLQSMVVGTEYRPLDKEGTLVPDIQGGSSAKCFIVSKKRRVTCEKTKIIQNSLEAGERPGNIAGSTQVCGKTMCLSTGKGHDVASFFPEDLIATDYVKLLELDNLEEETCYKMARESLLSPDLPQVDFLVGEIINEDKILARDLDLAASKSTDLCETIISSKPTSLNTRNDSATVKMPPMSTTLHGHIPRHFVVFSNMEDQNKFIKIFHAANNCVQRYRAVAKRQWAVQAILFSMKMEENLLGQERACVFLSLLLHNFSVVSSMKTGNTLNVDSFSCLDYFSKHIYGVMADTEAGGILSEFLEELLCLLQDLLSEQRVLFFVKSSEESDLSIPVTLNGEHVALVSRIALIDHLVAGSAILATICTALGRVGFIFEASFEILHKGSHEKTSVLLTILHVFAYIAGEKMVSSSEHDLPIAVLKSIVLFLEKRHFGTVEENALHPGKNKCPFSNKSSSLEAMASMLMNILQDFTQSNSFPQSLTSSLGSRRLEKHEFRPAHKDFQCELTRDQSVTLCHLCDILSLVEIIASYTAWDWTNVNFVTPLLKILEMPLPMNLSVAIISLLGQLSRIGVEACGYENEGVSNVGEKLSGFLQRVTTIKAGFAVQLATVSSLLKTLKLDISLSFQCKTTMLQGCNDQSLSASVNLVTKWFSLLSDDQRAFASEFFKTSVVG